MLNRILDKFTYVKDLKMRIRQLEAGFISMLEDPHMIYNNLQLDGKSVCIAFNRLEALRKTKEIKCSVMVGQDVVEFKTVLRGKADKE